MIQIDKAEQILSEQNGQRILTEIYGADGVERAQARYRTIIQGYRKTFRTTQVSFFSSPGRTEVGGNHTDHNHGKVLAGSINLDCIGVAGKNGTNLIHIHDITYNENLNIDVNDLEKSAADRGSVGLMKGILTAFRKFGWQIGGFDACICSNVIRAAGVSSSASFEMLICAILNAFFNDGKVDLVTYARAGQYAENVYWEKASGLLDQMACAVGGMIAIDFKNPAEPQVEKIDFDFGAQDYHLIIVNTGKSHADLNEDYSSIPKEVKSVAGFFGKEVCREISCDDVLRNLSAVRAKCGDRAVMRALHFFAENDRVDAQVEALKNNDFNRFLSLITASGNSSWKYLQNCYSAHNVSEQGICVALAATEAFLAEKNVGACRVHGGGFAGVIAVFVPKCFSEEYMSYIDGLLGEGSSYKMSIRNHGAIDWGRLL